jgi:hypothetical protein
MRAALAGQAITAIASVGARHIGVAIVVLEHLFAHEARR